MDRKFFDCSLFLLAGIILSYNLIGNLLSLSIIVFAILSIGFLIDFKNGDKRLMIASLFIFLGIYLVFANLKSGNLKEFRKVDAIYLATVDSINRNEDKTKLTLKVEKVNRKKLRKKEKLLLTYRGKREFLLGEKLEFETKLSQADRNKNPKLFNYRRHLKSKKIYNIGYIEDRNIIREVMDIGPGYRLKNKFRERVDTSLNLGFSSRNKDLLSSIILGENYLEAEEVNKYRNLGLAHILAVSGLHIGIISMSIFSILSLMKLNKNISRIIVIGFIWFYGYLINFPVSILRANIMLSILYLSKNLKEPYDYKNTLYLSLLILLIVNPFYIFSLSFILSFASTFSLAYIYPALKNHLKIFGENISGLISPIIAVNLGLGPILAYYFNSIQVLSLISNLLVVPLIGIVLNLIVILIILGDRLLLIKILLNSLLNLKFLIVDILGTNPLNLRSFSPDIGEILGYYIILFMILYPYKLRDRLGDFKKVILGNSLIYLGTLIYSYIFLSSLELNFIDVGQGDFCHIKYGAKNYIVDTGGESFGNFSVGKNISLPYLIKHNVGKIDALFLSHFHEDHVLASLDIVDELKVENIFVSYRPEENKLYKFLEKTGKLRELRFGNKLKLDRNLYIKVLGPSKNHSKENDKSLVFLLEHKNFRGLFTGDIEAEGEGELLKKTIPSLDLIKVAHHGSDTSSSLELLEKLRPRVGVISLGENNIYGHPSRQVLDNYEKINCKIFRTDKNGFISCRLENNRLCISSFLDKKDPSYLSILYFYFYSLGLLSYIDGKIKERPYLNGQDII